jgi:queuine tRNA-ribosyltransferase
MSRHEVVRTRSGALAMRNLAAGEVMHPGVGPLVEADRLYVRQSCLAERLRQVEYSPSGVPSTLVLFDIGMGAGTNAAAAISLSENAPVAAAHLTVVSFERDLDALKTALISPAAFGLDGATGEFARMLLRRGHHQTARTTWTLEHGDILDGLGHQTLRPDIVFWDPFSPVVNPTLWTIGAFAAIRRVAGPRCTLFTYSASTAVRTAMLLAGWMVGVGEGIGDKQATTTAAVRLQDLKRPLDSRWLTRLSRPTVPLPPDAPPGAAARVTACDQFKEAKA